MLLAHAGSDVVVLERKDRVGGRSAALRGRRLQVRSRPDLFPLPADPGRDLRRLRPSARGRGRAAAPGSHVPSDVRGWWRDPRERGSGEADGGHRQAVAPGRRGRASLHRRQSGEVRGLPTGACSAPLPAGAIS